VEKETAQTEEERPAMEKGLAEEEGEDEDPPWRKRRLRLWPREPAGQPRLQYARSGGMEGGEEEKRGQATSRLETDTTWNSGATSHHDGVEGERIIEDTAPAPEERQGEKLDNEIAQTDMDIYATTLKTIEQTPDEPDTDTVTTPTGTTLSRLQPVTPMVRGQNSSISLEEHIKIANQCTQNLMKKYQKK
jgi:hypothetical protein